MPDQSQDNQGHLGSNLKGEPNFTDVQGSQGSTMRSVGQVVQGNSHGSQSNAEKMLPPPPTFTVNPS